VKQGDPAGESCGEPIALGKDAPLEEPGADGGKDHEHRPGGCRHPSVVVGPPPVSYQEENEDEDGDPHPAGLRQAVAERKEQEPEHGS
jgi:hypothetical protein